MRGNAQEIKKLKSILEKDTEIRGGLEKKKLYKSKLHDSRSSSPLAKAKLTVVKLKSYRIRTGFLIY
jgi:hypothetical protein